ncbi:MAG: hypothetical protein Q4B59_00560 [Lachnospiraceae bacterium]|nr:hypothetical protein [Lachnospiraceae bacterium]
MKVLPVDTSGRSKMKVLLVDAVGRSKDGRTMRWELETGAGYER